MNILIGKPQHAKKFRKLILSRLGRCHCTQTFVFTCFRDVIFASPKVTISLSADQTDLIKRETFGQRGWVVGSGFGKVGGWWVDGRSVLGSGTGGHAGASVRKSGWVSWRLGSCSDNMYDFAQQLPAYTWPGSPKYTKTNGKIATFGRVVVGVVVAF